MVMSGHYHHKSDDGQRYSILAHHMKSTGMIGKIKGFMYLIQRRESLERIVNPYTSFPRFIMMIQYPGGIFR